MQLSKWRLLRFSGSLSPQVALLLVSLLFAGAAPAQNLVNGVTTSAWPTVGSLETSTGTCSATLIGCQTLLTAAHCVCELGGTGGPCPDGTTLLDPADYAVFIPHAGEFFVHSVQVAPGYQFGSSSDVALLELDAPVRSIAPELINSLSSPPFGSATTIVGFGTLSGTTSDSQIKREGDVLTSTCVGSGAPNATHLCWTDPASTTCLGDSGGPLFADVGAGTVVAGVHSGGSPLCTPGSPAFDTDVFVESGWISSTGGADLGFASCGDGAQVGEPAVVEDDFNAVVTTSADHTVSVAPGTKLLRVALNAEIGSPENDLDLYVKFGSAASPGDFDCGPQFENSMEICEFADPTPGTWHINVDVFMGGPAEYQVTSVQLPPNPAPPSLDGNDIVVADFRAFELIHVDGGTGNRAILSSTLSGSGSELAAPEGVILSADGTQILVANLAQLSLLSVDPATGDRSVVSGCTDLNVDGSCGLPGGGTVVGAGLDFLGPRFLAYENGVDPDLVVSDRSFPGIAAVVRVDPATGDRSVLSGCTNTTCGSTTGSGPLFDRPFGIAVAANGDIIVGDSFGLLRVDPVSGARSALSGCTDVSCVSIVGSGPFFVQPGELHIEASGDIVVVDGLRSVLRVDPSNGDRTVVSGCNDGGCGSPVGTGEPFSTQLIGLDLVSGGDFLVADSELQALIRVNGINGNRTIVSGCADAACSSLVGGGTAFTDPVGIVVPLPEPAGALALLAGSALLLELRRRRRG